MPSSSSMLRAALLASAATAASVDVAPRQMKPTTCADVHVFIAKGNNEPYPGRQGKLVEAICAGLPSCDYEDIVYTNPEGFNYCQSVTEGANNGNAQIVSYNQRCPNAKLVVSGYSQGAHIVGDLFAGGNGGQYFECQAPATPAINIATPVGRKIAAILTFGDVRHTANQPYNYLGGFDKMGAIPRVPSQLAAALNYAGVWRDYCAGDDVVCAGGNSVPNHLNYFDLYTAEAAQWVKGKLAEAGATPPPVVTPPPPGTAPASTSSVARPYGNGTVTHSWTVTTVTCEGTVTSWTTICPTTTSYVACPTCQTATYTVTGSVVPVPPQATHPVPAVSTKTTAASQCPGCAKPTGAVTTKPPVVAAGASGLAASGFVGVVGLVIAALM